MILAATVSAISLAVLLVLSGAGSAPVAMIPLLLSIPVLMACEPATVRIVAAVCASLVTAFCVLSLASIGLFYLPVSVLLWTFVARPRFNR